MAADGFGRADPAAFGTGDPAAFGTGDPAAFGTALQEFTAAVAGDPARAMRASVQFSQALAGAVTDSLSRLLGSDDSDPSVQPPPTDKRFKDPAWEEHPWFYAERQMYLAWSQFMRDLVAETPLDEPDAAKARFAVDRVVDSLAPTNFLWGNPTALRRAVETQGGSVLSGLENFLDDQKTNGGMPRQVDASELRVGNELACTPGKVVFRDDLMELIQYEPQTEKVFETPLLLSPPWINRYYIMDLAPGRSFVEWAVTHGHTTFAISYRNADESMRDVDLDDYLRGLARATDVVRDITGAPEVNLVGLCVGGTLAVMLLAHPKSEGGVRSATVLNTLVDFGEPGPLGTFIDAGAVEQLEERMAERGFMDGAEMAGTFNALRPNDLIWNYVTTSWLMGDSPPGFDILAWNSDSTNIPAATHSTYLRRCYLDNAVAKSEMELDGRRLELDRVDTDLYVLAAKEDHITPWKPSYATTQLLPGSSTRFVLTSSGHIAGIVNPPSPKRHHWTGGDSDLPVDPDAWLERATEHKGSWWDDWAAWIAERAGGRRSPPPMGSAAHRVLGEAPGTYVTS